MTKSLVRCIRSSDRQQRASESLGLPASCIGKRLSTTHAHHSSHCDKCTTSYYSPGLTLLMWSNSAFTCSWAQVIQ